MKAVLLVLAIVATIAYGLCSTGPAGVAGDIGPQGPCVNITDIPFGARECPLGGFNFTCGTTITKKVCHGDVGPQGAAGATGATGATGSTGATGAVGPPGPQGIPGLNSTVAGPAGAIGPIGLNGTKGDTGLTGTIGPAGPAGVAGPAGPAGGLLSIAEFYALMPSDNSATVAIGAPILFPQDGPTIGTDIVRSTTALARLVTVGIYEIFFQASITEAAQLGVFVNGALVTRTVVGRATGTNQISGHSLLTISSVNSTIGVYNAASPAVLTMTTIAGGTNAVVANMIIKRLS